MPQGKSPRLQRYSHVISLGHFCSVASEIGRYGFRDGSYPFDWVTCGLEPIVRLMDSEFAGFLEFSQLAFVSEGGNIVRDNSSGIEFYHDFDATLPLAAQYDSVIQKYERRIVRLKQSATERTLFVRYILDESECSYLDHHFPEVMASLRRLNPDNDLLLIGNADLPEQCGGHPVYLVAAGDDDVVARKFVGKNERLLRMFVFLPYPLAKRAKDFMRYHFMRVTRYVSKRVREGR